MAMLLEEATAALFARVSSVADFKIKQRVFAPWHEVPPAGTPALMMTSAPISPFDTPNAIPGVTNPLWRVETDVVIYVQSDNRNTPPSIALNEIVAALCDSLLRRDTDGVPASGAKFLAGIPGSRSTTLGGLCYYVRVSGTIERFEMQQGQGPYMSMATIPLEMVISS